ncbi:hypothetical protein LARI1_G007589 [Lachnellula arida]|uniref:Uncharacterized protein n=1 Tax=Lachnellula arida TaxID=1316785 RepID=A0A8T9B6E4_9HELO|nr:hypothetical protein LARI1_G007589 [Lachnellula arida]
MFRRPSKRRIPSAWPRQFQLKKLEQFQAEEERLPRETLTAIACLNIRAIANRDLKNVLSKPIELTREFAGQDEFENLIRGIDRENAYQKCTAKRLVKALGYGESRDSVLKARLYLKLLSDLREAGVTLLLFYRTKEFKTYFLRHPNELGMILSWNQLYHPCLSQLRLRAIAQAEGDFSGRCDLEDQDVFHRLHIPQSAIWRDDISEWGDSTEKENFLASHSIKPISGQSNTHLLRHGIQGDIDSNKSIYVNMIPYEGISGKKTLGGAIQGPIQCLWLDRSDVKGKLQWIRAAKTGQQTNVCLVWEGVNEDKRENTFCQYWRIQVVATRHIMPFDQLIRPV